MAGESFDAGEVHAEARLGRDRFREDLRSIRDSLRDLSRRIVRPRVTMASSRFDREVGRVRSAINSISRMRPVVTVTAMVRRALDHLREVIRTVRRAQRQRIDIDVNTSSGVANVRRLNRSLGDAAIRGVALVRALQMLTIPAVLIAITPYVLSLASSLVQASGAAALLPAGLFAIGAAAAALKIGLGGVGEALSALSKAGEEAAASAASAAKAQTAAAEQVMVAIQALEQAQVSANRTVIQGSEQVADARRAMAQAVTSSLQQVRDAERNLEDAQRTARQAQIALTSARRDAREELQQLRFSVEGAALSEEGAADSLQGARRRLAEAKAAGAGAEEIDDLDRAVRRADLSLRMAKDRYKDLKAENAEWAKQGIQASEGVQNAQESLSSSQQAVLNAERALRQAQVDGAADVANARRELRRTIRQTSWANIDATNSVIDAEHRLAQAMAASAEAMNTQSTAATAAAAAMAKLSPNARDLVTTLRSMGPAWTDLKLGVQERLLVGMAGLMQRLGNLHIPVLKAGLMGTAAALNTMGMEWGEFATRASAAEDLGIMFDNTNRSLTLMSPVLANVAAILTDIGVVGSSFLPRFGTWVTDLTTRWREFIAEARRTGALHRMIQRSIEVLKQMGRIIRNVGSMFGGLFDAVNASGRSFLDILESITGKAAAALRTPAGARGLTDFFINVRALVGSLVDRLAMLWPSVQAAGSAFMALYTHAAPWVDQLFRLVAWILPPFFRFIETFAPTIGPMLVAVGAIILATKLWAGAQWLLNAALLANPIGLIVVALVGLVAGVIYAWNNFEWFRTVVLAVWGAIKVASRVAWDVLKVVFDALWFGLRFLGAVIFTVFVAPWILAWKAAVQIVEWAWKYVLKPTWDGMVWLWQKVLAPALMWLWRVIFKPVWEGIGIVVRWVWRYYLKPTWDAIVWLWQKVLAPALMWLWKTIFEPAWNAMGAVVRWVWRNMIKPAWDAMVSGLNWVGRKFQSTVDWIGRIWKKITGFLAKPINFMINTVWNSGIRPAWNAVAMLLGLAEIAPRDPIPETYAQGGVREDHTAQIARAGAWRVWAEDETGGEAYIPLAQSKRGRSMGVLNEVADRFGQRIVPQGNPSFFADAGLWRRMFGIVRNQFPRATLNSDYRPGDPGYHGQGKATDLGGNMGAINKWLANNFANSTELIYTPGINLFRGRPHTYNAGTRADHYDHVHWAMQNEAMLRGAKGNYTGGGGGSGIMGWLRDRVVGIIKKVVNPLIGLMPKAPPEFKNIPRGMMTTIRDKMISWFGSKADEQEQATSAVGPPGAGVERWRGMGLNALNIAGQSPTHINRLLMQMNSESSGNPRAVNRWDSNWRKGTPSVGLMQVIGPTYDAYHHPRHNVGPYMYGTSVDPLSNTLASIRYTLSRYGSLPSGWRGVGYDGGGLLQPGYTLAYNGTGGMENVLTDDQLGTVVRGGMDHGQLQILDDLATLVADREDDGPFRDLYVTTPRGASASEMVETALLHSRVEGKSVHRR